MAIDTLGANALASNSVTTAKIANDAVTGAKIPADAVVAADIADGSITTAKLVANAVTNAKLAGSIADSKITALTASKLTGAMPALDGSALTGIDADAVLLQSQTANAASAITVGTASLFSSTYTVYKIIGSNIHHSSDGATGRAVFVLGGAEKTGFHYRRVRARMYSGSASIASDRAHSGDAFWDLCYGESIGSAAGEITNFEMTIWSPNTTDNYKGALVQSFGQDSSLSCQWQFSTAVYANDYDTPLTGVKFYPAAGTIASGQFRLYGLKAS